MKRISILFMFACTLSSLLSAAQTDDISRLSSSQSIPRSNTSVANLGLLIDENVTKEFCEKYGVLQSVAPNAVARARYAARLGQRVGLPAAVKNWEYLPKVGDQGQRGSCAAYSSCYYYKTFQEAREYGWVRPDPVANPEHSMSPAFIYNMSNGGVGSGTYIETNMELLVENGCATQKEMPYLDSDYITWPSSSVWKHAIAYRAETATTINLSTDEGITALKQHCANGDIAVIGIYVYDNFYAYPSSTKIDNDVFYDDDGDFLGGHAITVVGYDDTKAYNDGTGTQYGAFLLVNSWGTSRWGIQDDLNGNGIIETGYEDGGICWVSYSYIKKMLSSTNPKRAYILTDKINYTPTTYAVVGLTHSNRSMVSGVCFSTSTDTGATEYSYFNWDQSLRVLVSTNPSTVSNQCGFGGNHPIDQCVYFDLTGVDTTTVTTAVIAQLREGKNRYGSDNPNGTITYLTVQGADGSVVRTSTQTPKSWTMYNTICEFVLEDPVPKAHITLSPPSPLQCGTENISLRIEPAYSVISTITLTCVYAHGRTTAIPLSMQNSLWVGSMVIDQGTPQGTGHFTFHAVDSFGYTGTTILEGETFVVDTGVVPSKLMVYPNPCEMRQSGYVHIGNIPSNVQNLRVCFYDITGALVKTLDTNSDMSSDGTLRIANWDGKNDHGNAVASGIYFCVVKADGYSRTAKVAIIN